MRIIAIPSWALAGVVCFSLAARAGTAQESTTNVVAPKVEAATETNAAADEALRAFLHLQEQLHEAQLTMERNRMEAEEASARNAKVVSERLQSIEQALSEERAGELEAVQRANHTMLLVVSAFAALGCLAIFMTAFFQWRAVTRFTTLAPAFPANRTLGPIRAVAALEGGERPVPEPVADPTSARLIGALERLDQRIRELERASRKPLNDAPGASNILDLPSGGITPATEPAEAGAPVKDSETGSLLAKGQALLNESKWEEAVACFDAVLARNPNQAEALVKKGTALERLRRPQDALSCYDQAIAADSSLTIAYLYKGGLFNRMERFNEALECYERALHTQEKRRAS